MRSVISLLVVINSVSVTAAQGSSCHYQKGCTPPPDVCSGTPPACHTDWFGTFCQMHNIARDKTAKQSSTWPENTYPHDADRAVAGRAVDGNISTVFSSGSCSHTDELSPRNASWQVDLNGTFLISRITIYLRSDGTVNYRAMEVLVNNRTCTNLPVRDFRNSSNHLIYNPVPLNCTQPIEGNSVSIVMAGQFLALCEVQVFGEKKEQCHCSNGCLDFPKTSCSTPSSGRVCKTPWFGPFCQMKNIAFQKTASQNSNYNESSVTYCAAYAVDGNTDTDFSNRSCSHTNVAPASWQVLLDDHQMFNISRIRIYLRRDPEFWIRNSGMQVYVNGDQCIPGNGSMPDWTSRPTITHPVDITCTPVKKGNNVTITITGQFLALCEVQVFVCSNGWFGSDCDKQCQCLNTSEVCDKETGYCRSGCADGKQGPGCQNQDCDQGHYGINCSSTCGQCNGSFDCNNDNGTCTQGCQQGYSPPLCQDCEEGRYGANCSQQCGWCKVGSSCNTATGVCPQGCTDNFEEPDCKFCSNGWFGTNCSEQCKCQNEAEACNETTGFCTSGCRAGKTGVGCQDDCPPLLYGINCSSTCGQCLSSSDCKKDDGTCTQGCQPGYQPPYCKACCDGWFGTNCIEQCKCQNETEACDKITGFCTSGCRAGKTGGGCQDDCDKGHYGVNCSSTCGQCNGSSDCNNDNGTCTQGCRQGYSPPLCQGCSDGWFGTNCSEQCKCQNETEACNKTTGFCTSGCRAGKTGDGCQDVCSDGWFGTNCSEQCKCQNETETCNKTTGFCTSGCRAGKTGDGCQDDCPPHLYGVNCSSTCGQCLSSSDCRKDDGTCTQGCQTGYLIPLCKACSDGWFGTNCSEQCKCQNETEVCDKTTGFCTSGCRAGKTGDGCQEDCDKGHYGVNCSSTCGQCNGSSYCNNDNGTCTQGCQQGYSSPLCKDCVPGIYGNNCLSICGHCKNGKPCDPKTGYCENGCAAGYEKAFCSEECAHKTYGQDCSSTCGRCLNGTCSKTDGTCVHGCELGFEGDQCVTATQTGNKQDSSWLTGVVVGVVLGVLAVAAVVSVVVYIRRKRRLQKSYTEDQPEEDTTESSFSAVSNDRIASSPLTSAKPVKPVKKPKHPRENVYENSDTYYNVLPTSVPLERLRQYVKKKVTGMGFEQEYKMLRHGLAKEHTEGQKPENKKRNRFLALFPYDESRVVLAPDGDATCDYIHASYVQGFHEANVFIAAQGPNNVTVDDFWRMIWQEHVSQIIMLTRVMELNRKKCEQYWPDGTRDKKCGNIVIKPLLSTVRADFTIRKFLVQHAKTPSDKRTVTQLHFTSWPDHDVPSAPALVGFWKQYRSLTSSEEDITGPVVVHCSAGVGRTGTFIALDNLFDEAESVNKVNVFACVSKLREARMNMVQTLEQYRFVHEAVIEAVESRGTFYTLSDFEGKFGTGLKYTRQQDMQMNKEFQSLESTKMEIPEKLVSDAYLPANVCKNRNKNIVPANRGRPFLSTPVAHHNDYINAVILPSATQPLGLIATQTPMSDTVVDFWRLVFDHDCFTIVCLEDEGENQAIYPRKNESLSIGPFRITTLKEDTSRDSFTEMELNLALREQDNTLHQIRVFKVRSPIPGPTEPILAFVNEIERKGSSEEHKTLVHCLDGARLCGVFCSVLNIISRLRLDKEVDIYLTIRELQCIRPQFIQTYDQYKFCYDLVKENLRDTSMYANM